ncbi:MAG TPA: NAD(P)-binding protein [Acidobacteriota bacterium]|nr:NAD(P)-binding protein [Acidobacteriota bacterium]
MKRSDRELGMDREINRRDFVSGTSIAITGAVLVSGDVEAQGRDARPAPAASPIVDQSASQETYYPPTRTGMRGSHPGSFEVAHEMRFGETWDDPQETGEEYDLIVVGGGLSGLGAAYYFRKALPEARVLILENHDDFGGHAKRNEAIVDGRQVIGWGGTTYITGAYTYEGLELMHDIGLDAEAYRRENRGRSLRAREPGLGSAVLFDEETFGEDRLVVGVPGSNEPEAWTEWLRTTPLSDRVQKDIAKLYQTQEDFFPGLSVEDKIARLRKMSYQDYLLDVVGVHPDVIPFFKRRAPDANGSAGIDTLSVWAAFRFSSLPGLQGLGLGDRPPRNGFPGLENPFDGMHFPDGNAGIARLLVRWLIPGSLPGTTMNDSVSTRVRYSTLDRADNDVRIRLNSTVVKAHHVGDRAKANAVDLTYVRDGQAHRVRGGTCVMACNNAVIPYLCPELPEDQKDHLHMAVRRPFVAGNAVVRNWQAFERLGVRSIHCPGAYFEGVSLDGYSNSFGDYQTAQSPDEPAVVGLWGSPVAPGVPARDQWRAVREELLAMSFETFERGIRDQLARALGEGGFDPARDIEAIFVNRWPHGYAGAGNDLFDPDWEYDEAPWVLGRKRFGRIAIANSDAAASCLTQAAFDQAHRAVQELITDVIRPEFQYPWAERT